MAQAESLVSGREYSLSSAVILDLSSKNAVSACDAEFVGLAMQLGTRLITTDKPLLRKFPDVAVSPEEFVAG
jgi:predicted nucleic acid-binding protein